MEKSDLKKHYQALIKFYDDFVEEDFKSVQGESLMEREMALIELNDILRQFDRYVSRYPELKDYLVKRNDTKFSKQVIWDDFKSISYFQNDIGEKLVLMKELLEEKTK